MIKSRLKQESIEALKAHNNRKVEVLRFLISLIDKKELQLPVGTMKEVDEIGVLRKELKNKEESREMFVKANRDELVQQVDYEIEVVKEYLPAEIDEDQVTKIVEEVIKEQGNNFGLIMKEVMNKLNGAVDGSVISKIVKEKING
ncbi:MAG: GatB/YqeY domain-containing protein [Candidatus Shapirobacteria bacterium]|nr:GatB/YqeY domain-containing protein [Candidatus Shapirobacteria bacterium]